MKTPDPHVIDKLRDAMKRMEKCIECTVCLHQMSVPVRTSCGHTFCDTCIKKILTKRNAQCPLCNAKLTRRNISRDNNMTMYIEGIEKLKRAIHSDVGSNILPQSPQTIGTKESHSPSIEPRSSVFEMPSTSADVSAAGRNSLPKASAPRNVEERNSIEGKSVFHPTPSEAATNVGRKRGRKRKSSNSRNRSGKSWSKLNVSRSLTRSLSPPKISPKTNNNANAAMANACHNSPPVLIAEAKRSLNSSLIRSPGKLLENPEEIRKRVIASRQLFLDRAKGGEGNTIEKPSSESLKAEENLAATRVERSVDAEGLSEDGGPARVNERVEITDPARLDLLSSERGPSARKNVATFLYMARTGPKVAAKESQILRSKATQTAETKRIVQSTQTDNAVDSSPMIRIPLESFELGVPPAKKLRRDSDDARGNESSQWPKTPPRTDSHPEPAASHESFVRLSGSTKTVSGPASSRDIESLELEESTKLTSCPKATCSNDSFERFVTGKADRPERSTRLQSIERQGSPAEAERTLRNVSVLPAFECLEEPPPAAATAAAGGQRRLSAASSESKWSGASTVIMEADELPKKDYKRIIPGTESDSSDGPILTTSAKGNQSRNKKTKRRRSSTDEEEAGKADSVNDVVSQWCQNSGSTQRSNKKTRPSSALSRKSNVLPDKPRALAALSDESTNVDDIITNWCRDARPIRRFIEGDKSSGLARENSGSLLKRGSTELVNALKVATPLRDTSTMDSMGSDSERSFRRKERQEVAASKLESGGSFAPKSSDKSNTSGTVRRDTSTMDVLCATQISINRSRLEEEGEEEVEEFRAKRTDIDPPLNPHKSHQTYRGAMGRTIVSTARKSMSNAHARPGSLEPSLNPHKSSDRIPGEAALATDSVRAAERSFKKSGSGDIPAESGKSNSTLNSRKTSLNAGKPSVREVARYASTMESACMTQDPFNKARTGLNKANVKTESAKPPESSAFKFMRASELENSRDTSPSDDLFESCAASNVAEEGMRVAADRFNDDIIDRVRELQRNDAALKNSERTALPAVNPALEDNFDEIIANVDSADLIGDFPFSDPMNQDSDRAKVEPPKLQVNSDDDPNIGSDDLGTLVVSLGGSCGSVPEPIRTQSSRIQKLVQKPDDKPNRSIPKNTAPIISANTTLTSLKQEATKNVVQRDAKLSGGKGSKDDNANDGSEQDSLMDVTQHQMLIQAFEDDLFGGLPWSPVKRSEGTPHSKDGKEQPEQRTPQDRKKDIKRADHDKDAEHSAGEDDIVESTPETKVKNSRGSSRSRTPTPAKKFLNMSQCTPLSKQLHRLTSNATLVGSALKPLQHSTPKVLPKVVPRQRNETPSSSRGSPILKTNVSRLESASALRQGRVVQRKVSVVCSSLTPQQIERVKAFARIFDGSFKSLFDEGVTHVIVKTEGNTNAAQKTLKYLQGVAHGKWVVSYEWVVESMAKRRLVDEEPYEVVESPNLEDGPRRSRLSQRNLFADFAFMLCGPYADVSVKQIQDMLLFNGATVLETPVELAAERKKLKVVALCEESTVAQDSIEAWSRRIRAAVVSHVWIIECISRYRVVSLYPYLLRLEPEDVLAFGFPLQLLEDDEADSE